LDKWSFQQWLGDWLRENARTKVELLLTPDGWL